MKKNDNNDDQEAIEKLKAFKNKLDSESSGVDPLDILAEDKKRKKGAQVPNQRQGIPPQRERVPPRPRQGQAQNPQQQQQQIRDTNLVLGTALINIFERFGQQLTPTEEAAILTAIGERCPWYIEKLRAQMAQRAAAAQSQQQYAPESQNIEDDSLMEDQEDPDIEYVPFADDPEDGSVTG